MKQTDQFFTTFTLKDFTEFAKLTCLAPFIDFETDFTDFKSIFTEPEIYSKTDLQNLVLAYYTDINKQN